MVILSCFQLNNKDEPKFKRQKGKTQFQTLSKIIEILDSFKNSPDVWCWLLITHTCSYLLLFFFRKSRHRWSWPLFWGRHDSYTRTTLQSGAWETCVWLKPAQTRCKHVRPVATWGTCLWNRSLPWWVLGETKPNPSYYFKLKVNQSWPLRYCISYCTKSL